MGRDIVKNLKFKKHAGKHFDPERFAQLLDESYRNTKRADSGIDCSDGGVGGQSVYKLGK